jgi:hypothetical protein
MDLCGRAQLSVGRPGCPETSFWAGPVDRLRAVLLDRPFFGFLFSMLMIILCNLYFYYSI